MSEIVELLASEILDSRGNPTVQVECWTATGGYGCAKVPSGASTGSREALELRDHDPKRYHGLGVLTAVENVNTTITEALCGWEVTDQRGIDHELNKLDGTPNKAKLGANAILGVSMAVAKAAAEELQISLYRYLGGSNAHVLPVPLCNVINGGAHADNTIDFQEFMIVPVGAQTFSDGLRMVTEVFHQLKTLLKTAGHTTTVGDEGGFAPNLKTPEEALDFMLNAVKVAGYPIGPQGVMIALDVAAAELYNAKTQCYEYPGETKALQKSKLISRSTAEQVAYLKALCAKYPLVSIEDGLDENDWAGFRALHDEVGQQLQIVGDDLFVTNVKYVARGIREHAANSALIKVNQIGSLTETCDTIREAQIAGWTAVVSHRSGETSDNFIADLAVAFNTGQIKTGSLSRSDRLAKYNRLLEIESELGSASSYLGASAFKHLKPEHCSSSSAQNK